MVKRVILIVLDSVGIGELPDADKYGDRGSNTLGHIAEKYPNLHIPNLVELGLGIIDLNNQLGKTESPQAAFGKAAEVSSGKDTTTGHWEIAGIILEKPFPTFTENGFPIEFIERFEKEIGTKTLGNISASGTAIIDDLGDEHLATGYPIVYTSADSVFQIAMHEGIIPIERQYEICKIAREMLVGEYEVGRVIARPFEGESGNFKRTSRRKDYAILPPDTVLDVLKAEGKGVYAIGKINDIFAEKGISRYKKTATNLEGIKDTIEAIKNPNESFIFTNLVDFDMLFGHRRDEVGYAKCLEEFDSFLPEILRNLTEDDLLIITADHGNDPTHHGNDHTREYIPILNIGKNLKKGVNIGIRNSFADIAATIAEYLEVDYKTQGESYLSLML
ncbi:phosphopentomutase [Lacihabitans sp. LS3-19]|nr:phosphopentomutase [Lacihabitans sp. LS3-19]